MVWRQGVRVRREMCGIIVDGSREGGEAAVGDWLELGMRLGVGLALEHRRREVRSCP